MRNALRDAELPPPAGGWERLQRELGGAVPGAVAPEAKPRGSVWRIYWPRIAAAAAAVLICVVAGEFLLRPDKALENDGTVIASVAEDGAAAVAIPQPAEPETVRDALAKAVGLPRVQAAGDVSSAGGGHFSLRPQGSLRGRRPWKMSGRTVSLRSGPERRRKVPDRQRRRWPEKQQRRLPAKGQGRSPERPRRRPPAERRRNRLPGSPRRGRRQVRPAVRHSPASRSWPTPNRIRRRRSRFSPAAAWQAETAKGWLPGCVTIR